MLLRGVDIDESIIEQNKIAVPDAIWIKDDFLHAMKIAYNKGEFNPGIINADLVSLAKHGAVVISEILSFLSDIEASNFMLVCNVMLNNPHGKDLVPADVFKNAIHPIFEEFDKIDIFQDAWRDEKLKIYHKYYCYNGTGRRSRTVMCSFLFY